MMSESTDAHDIQRLSDENNIVLAENQLRELSKSLATRIPRNVTQLDQDDLR